MPVVRDGTVQGSSGSRGSGQTHALPLSVLWGHVEQGVNPWVTRPTPTCGQEPRRGVGEGDDEFNEGGSAFQAFRATSAAIRKATGQEG